MNKQINRPSHESELRFISMKARLGRRSKIAIKLLSPNLVDAFDRKKMKNEKEEDKEGKKNAKIAGSDRVPLSHIEKMSYESLRR